MQNQLTDFTNQTQVQPTLIASVKIPSSGNPSNLPTVILPTTLAGDFLNLVGASILMGTIIVSSAKFLQTLFKSLD
jgi:hypothetical protein